MEPASAPPRRAGVAIAVLCLTGVLTAMQQTFVVPLLPELPDLLSTTPTAASWLVTATLIAGAVATPVAGQLADTYGKRLLIMGCLCCAVVGSVVGALSTHIGPAIVARALQGIGVATIPIGIALMRDILPPRRLPFGVALLSATLAIGSGAGLPLAGLVARSYDWHLMFWLSGFLGVVLLVLVPLTLPRSVVRARPSFDLLGALMLGAALTAALLAITKGADWGWTSWATVSCVVGAVVVFAAWVPVERRAPNPVVDLRTLLQPRIVVVNVASTLVGFAMFVNLLSTTQFLQMPRSTGYGQALDVVETGLVMAPVAAVFGALAPVAAALIRRYGAEAVLLCGCVVMAATYLARIALDRHPWQVVAGACLVAVGTALTFAAMPALVMSAVPVHQTASANGINSLLRSVGTSLGSAVVAAVLTLLVVTTADGTFPSEDAFVVVFVMSAVAASAAAVLAGVLTIMRRRGP
ncbi:MFS transporter [Jiangella mangrovi]|uniref:MFS family permease n=1 Tax=Jiangella mangrovi TaxID=1524084 RepID=A0A7W9GU65_9ACTN|nr:MFS transporter [Jiangella mangrovi]MBB5790084.1 MFS family permease [Jiangella mangrovi]